MKRAMMFLFVASALLSNVGCHLANRHCNYCSGPLGCRPCNMGWQRGGTDYQRFLGCNHTGCGQAGCGYQAAVGAHGHGGAMGHGGHGHGGLLGHGHGGLLGHGGVLGHGDQFAAAQPSGAGMASGDPMAQVAYPYYTTRGPRDFFMDNPPTIGR